MRLSNKDRPGMVAALAKDGEVLGTGASKSIPGRPKPVFDELTEAEVGASERAAGDAAAGYSRKCAELSCVAASRLFAKVSGGIIAIKKIGKAGDPRHGAPAVPCATCKNLLRMAGVTTSQEAQKDAVRKVIWGYVMLVSPGTAELKGKE